ncbi:MAG: Lrp/AsnC family transcriptional regulator [Nitrososphaerota archaeon]
MRGTEKLDEVDHKILAELIKNARVSYRELAKKLGLSVATVAYRVTKLQKSGLIKGFTTLINYEEMGYEITAIIKLVIKEGRLLEVQREIAAEKNVVAVYDVTGEVDSIVICRFKDRQEMSAFIKRILKMPYVERSSTHVVLEVVKEDLNSLFTS